MVRGAYSINTTPILDQIITLGNLYLTHDIDFSSISLKSDLGSVALVSACSKKINEFILYFFKYPVVEDSSESGAVRP